MKAKGSAAAPPDVRTPTQTYIARWWQSNPMISWNDVGTQLARSHGFDALAAARLFAMQNLSGADAAISAWNDKYHFDFWRPWNAIRRAGEDNNPATDADATWSPLISAPYPEYPSGAGSGQASTSARPMFKVRYWGGTSPTTWPRTTSRPWATH